MESASAKLGKLIEELQARNAVLERALENTRHNYQYGKPPVVCDGYCALHECVCPSEDEDEH